MDNMMLQLSSLKINDVIVYIPTGSEWRVRDTRAGEVKISSLSYLDNVTFYYLISGRETKWKLKEPEKIVNLIKKTKEVPVKFSDLVVGEEYNFAGSKFEILMKNATYLAYKNSDFSGLPAQCVSSIEYDSKFAWTKTVETTLVSKEYDIIWSKGGGLDNTGEIVAKLVPKGFPMKSDLILKRETISYKE
jgi:hypothetical protein